MKKPADPVTLSAEEGENLIAQVHQSNLPAAVAGRLEQIIRTCFWLVFVLQETKITVNRLRRLLFGKVLTSSAAPEDVSAPMPGGGDEPYADAVLHADAGEAAPTAGAVSPGPSQSQEPTKAKGGHRAGTGRPGAEVYVGAERMECRHEELRVGQRCPVCGRGTLYELPPGVEIRIDGNALLSAIRYELEKLRCSACGETFTAGLPAGVREKNIAPGPERYWC